MDSPLSRRRGDPQLAAYQVRVGDPHGLVAESFGELGLGRGERVRAGRRDGFDAGGELPRRAAFDLDLPTRARLSRLQQHVISGMD